MDLPLAQTLPENSGSLQPALTVTELTLRLKKQLEQSYPNICVQGEISNYKRHSSGHLYFTLKDQSAQLQVALFQNYALRLLFEPKDGDKVQVRGEITLYSQRGSYQLSARQVEKVGLGEILLELEALKKELKGLGWLDRSSKKELPTRPERIGVVTSPTGAVIRDMIHVLSQRHSGFHLLLYPTHVQGSSAAAEIAQAIDYLNQHKLCDLIILARGGGSFEDLMPFNRRELLEAVHNSQIPILSAIGHETDFTLCDYVADKRAPTPSAAAEQALPSKKEESRRLRFLKEALLYRLQELLSNQKAQLQNLQKNRKWLEPLQLLAPYQQFLDESLCHLNRQMLHRLSQTKLILEHYAVRFSPKAIAALHAMQKERLQLFQIQLPFPVRQKISQQKNQLLYVDPKCRESFLALWKKKKERLDLFEQLLSIQRLQDFYRTSLAKLDSIKERLHLLSPQAALRRGYALLKDEKGAQPKHWHLEETLFIETATQHLVASITQAKNKTEASS